MANWRRLRHTAYRMTRAFVSGASRAGGSGRQAHGSEFPPDFDPAIQELCRYVVPYSMTSPERIFAIRSGIEYIVRCRVPGDIVECGVWKGGSMMAVAKTLTALGENNRMLHLFDTFGGMSEPTAADVTFRGQSAANLMAGADKGSDWIWAYSPLEEVTANLYSTGYPPDRMRFIQGKVEDTIPTHAPSEIALLRLDTDWYESTWHELFHLYPRLSPAGVLIIDDYGHWAGARKAVDQYFSEQRARVLLNRIDYTARICIKPA